MTLKDYILTYKKDDKIVANLYDYYELFIKNLSPEFQKYSYYNQNLVLCFFKDHDDVNPSMGWIKHKTLPSVKVCHCFGCGRTADVVRLHQILSKQYFNKDLSEKDACIEVGNLFDIPIDDYDDSGDDLEKRFQSSLHRVDKLKTYYTIREFSDELKEQRKSGVDLNKVNSACVRMIASSKKLYE